SASAVVRAPGVSAISPAHSWNGARAPSIRRDPLRPVVTGWDIVGGTCLLEAGRDLSLLWRGRARGPTPPRPGEGGHGPVRHRPGSRAAPRSHRCGDGLGAAE